MDLYCTRPGCPKPVNPFSDLDDTATLKSVQQKYCTTCGMPLILDGRYLPQKLLGQGGFGAAFLARDRRMPGMRQCVVKLFQPIGHLSAEQLEVAQRLFEREAEALEDLGNAHPQIPDLFAFFELTVPGLHPEQEDKFFYLVQEFIDGQTMEEELAQKGLLSAAEVTEMLEAILPVLAFVHEHGSIHRDIKPSNIMRHRNGCFYLLDFGAVRQVTKVGAKPTGIYSLGFAPPEQVAGNEVYASTDLYALAVTCIMLLTGKQPSELFESYHNAWGWRSQAPAIHEPLATVLDRMLLAAPSQRFQSAAEVLAALKHPSATVALKPTSARPAAPPSGASPLTVLPPPPKPSMPHFSTLELLSGAAFTGFEVSLLTIALVSFLGTTLVSTGLWVGLAVAALVFFQWRRVIERVDRWMIATMTLAIVLFLVARTPTKVWVMPGLGNPWLTVVFLAGMVALTATVVLGLFLLILRLLRRIF